MKRKFLSLLLLAPLAFAPLTACSKENKNEPEQNTICAHITGDIVQATGWKNTIITNVNGCFILSEALPNTGYFQIQGLEKQGWLRASNIEIVENCPYCCGETLNRVYGE